MAKFGFISLFMFGITFFVSCSNNAGISDSQKTISDITKEEHSSLKDDYGTYIAGRVAHLRSDFDNAANYYMKILDKTPDNPELLLQTYLMLTLQSRLDKAAHYAKIAQEKGDKNLFIYVILSVDNLKKEQYLSAI